MAEVVWWTLGIIAIAVAGTCLCACVALGAKRRRRAAALGRATAAATGVRHEFAGASQAPPPAPAPSHPMRRRGEAGPHAHPQALPMIVMPQAPSRSSHRAQARARARAATATATAAAATATTAPVGHLQAKNGRGVEPRPSRPLRARSAGHAEVSEGEGERVRETHFKLHFPLRQLRHQAVRPRCDLSAVAFFRNRPTLTQPQKVRASVRQPLEAPPTAHLRR